MKIGPKQVSLSEVRRLARTRIPAWAFAFEWAVEDTDRKCERKTTSKETVLSGFAAVVVAYEDSWTMGTAKLYVRGNRYDYPVGTFHEANPRATDAIVQGAATWRAAIRAAVAEAYLEL